MIGCRFPGERHNLWDVKKRDFISDLFCFFGLAGLLFSDFCASTHPSLASFANTRHWANCSDILYFLLWLLFLLGSFALRISLASCSVGRRIGAF
jgi:hypothetical protein